MHTAPRIVILVAFMFGSIVFSAGMSAQPVPLCSNNLHPSYYYGRDCIVATTQTQLAVQRHGTTTWEYRDAPYPARHWGSYVFQVYYANGDTVRAFLAYLARKYDGQNRLELLRSTDEGRTWTSFYQQERTDYHVQFASGYTVLVQSRVRDTCAAMAIDDAGAIRSCLQITTPFIRECTPAPDHTYLLCRHYYDNIDDYDYGGSLIRVEGDGLLSKIRLPGSIGTASTTTGPVPYQRIRDRLIVYHQERQDTIIVPEWFVTLGGMALFDSSLYALGIQQDPKSETTSFTVNRWRIGSRQQDVSSYPSCWDSPFVRGDTLLWCDFDGLRYQTKGNEHLNSIPFPPGLITPVSVSWADSSLCYYLRRGDRTSDAPDIYRLLTVSPDDTLHRNLFVLPYRTGTSCLGSRTSHDGTEIRSLIHYQDTARRIQVLDISPRNGATARYEYEDSAAIQFWYEVGDTTWYCQAGTLFMKTPGFEPRSLLTLRTVIGPVTSMACYRGDLFLLGRFGYYPDDSSIVLKCSFRTDTAVQVMRMLAWDSRSAYPERLVVMDSCLTISGLPDDVDHGTTVDGIRFDLPAYHGTVTRQGSIACVLRRLEEKGRYEVCTTTAGRSLIPLDTIPFHPYRAVLGAYLLGRSIAIVSDEGTWLFPSKPLGTTTEIREADHGYSNLKDKQHHDAVAIHLPYEMNVGPSSSYRHIRIHDVGGSLAGMVTIPPGATAVPLRNLNRGTYVVIIPDIKDPIVRTIIVE